eukprot:8581246-Alexandrium_andersonii.AAC.1
MRRGAPGIVDGQDSSTSNVKGEACSADLRRGAHLLGVAPLNWRELVEAGRQLRLGVGGKHSKPSSKSGDLTDVG